MIGPVVAALVTLAAARARAQEPVAPPAPTPDATARAVHELERENQALRDRVDSLEAEQELRGQQIDQLLPLSGRLSGYVDFGFFVVGGNGAGTRSDVGNLIFPEYAGIVPGSWVFLGDPLSTAVNSRGEPADTGDSRALTFDPVDSQGHPTFLLNTLSLSLFAGIGDRVTLNGTFDLIPRGRDAANPDGLFLGDYLDVKLAYVEWRAPVEAFRLDLAAGKLDSVLGREYRRQDAPVRTTVSPSLICRYTCGHPLGLRARGRWLDEKLILNLTLTNGSHFWEGFGFADEVNRNSLPTGAGRLSYRVERESGRALELGVSGAYGAQDAQASADVRQWHYGADALLELDDLELSAEFVQGKAEGSTSEGSPVPCDAAACLKYKGAYGLVLYRLSNWLAPYTRVDWRDALHVDGASFVYVSQLWRLTGGVRLELGASVIVKAEYTLNRELGELPQFDDDVFTTSLVVKY